MSEFDKLRKKETIKSAKYANRIRQKLKDLKIPFSKKTEGLPTDLGDIQEICKNYLNSIEMLFTVNSQKDKKMLTEIFEGIRNDLYIHLYYHLKELKKPLNLLIKELEVNKGEKGKKGKRSNIHKVL